MNYSEIKNFDIANGLGVRVSLFVSGCRNACPGCFNPSTWDFAAGSLFTEAVEDGLLKMLEPSYVRGLTLLGGEPFEPENQRVLLPFLERVRRERPEKDVWCFSGFTFEEMQSGASRCCTADTEPMLALIDVLVDGRFVAGKKDISLRFRGSSNQRILDVPASLKAGTPVAWQSIP
ncbi:MAG: anaerobic ribonucleoside-triphosphate reductase activating protein [Kiritimatiellae bacterium]|nr:anaerobic ribonucleoside-triphosphate reductase activating protein [Kiritimatiellia bacterium]